MNSQKIAEINRKAWNNIAKQGKTIHPTKGKKEAELLDVFIKSLPKGGKVLDLGCGMECPSRFASLRRIEAPGPRKPIWLTRSRASTQSSGF